MFQLSNAANAILERCLKRCGSQSFGSCFQHAVAASLNRVEGYKGCYGNPAAGQPDIIAGKTGLEVKSSSGASISLQGNYASIRAQYDHFRLIGLRTDRMLLWALVIPAAVPSSVSLGRIVSPPLAVDSGLSEGLRTHLSWVLEAAGTEWSDAGGPDEARKALERLLAKH